MVSGEVTATTLSILKFKDRFPLEFETIVTTADGALQYQLKTIVRQRRELRLERIDSPEYLLRPPMTILSQKGGTLDFQCALFVLKENSSFTNELTISRVRAYPGTAGLSSLWVSRTGSASDWCALQEALYKCIDTIQ